MAKTEYFMVFILLCSSGILYPTSSASSIEKYKDLFQNENVDYFDVASIDNVIDDSGYVNLENSIGGATNPIPRTARCRGKIILFSESLFESKAARNWKPWPNDLTQVHIHGDCCFKVFSSPRSKGEERILRPRGEIEVVDFAVRSLKKVPCN